MCRQTYLSVCIHTSLFVYCCNLSGGVALIVWFTTNGMCVKNNTIMYVARTSNNRVIPMEWSWWVTSDNALTNTPGEQLIVLVNGDGESDLVGWSLLLLAATVRSSAHMLLGISNRNSTIPQVEKHCYRLSCSCANVKQQNLEQSNQAIS